MKLNFVRGHRSINSKTFKKNIIFNTPKYMKYFHGMP